MSFKVNNIVRIRTVDFKKTKRHEGPAYTLDSRRDFLQMPVPTEIICRIEEIKDRKYVVSVGSYKNGKFIPTGEKLTFSEMYMLRFSRCLC